ncbi:MAG: MoxR family ATPase [Candidatus Atribacteria bacterium]|nr:MoxR family ATPase [Candidatus Atribacteria bacterium]
MEIDKRIQKIIDNVEKIIKGKRDKIILSLVPLVSEGHLIYIDIPGVGKTTLGEAIANSIETKTSRIQFTADLLPSDIIGVSIFNRENNAFEFKKGPIFANIVIADEINRAPPKTQSALLEGMSERSVTVDNITYALPTPFLVIATENPVEFTGTYALLESELDRFMISLDIGYPDSKTELEILAEDRRLEAKDLKNVVTMDEIKEVIDEAKQVSIDESVLKYLYEIVQKTRVHRSIKLGISTRGMIDYMKAAKGLAKILGRSFVIPDDIKTLAKPVIKHRLIFKEKDLRSQDEIIEDILNETKVPV